MERANWDGNLKNLPHFRGTGETEACVEGEEEKAQERSVEGREGFNQCDVVGMGSGR